DSYAAGEGAPRRNGAYDREGNLPNGARAAVWGYDDREDAHAAKCHRSKNSGHYIAYERLKAKYPDVDVTFDSVACSGAEVEVGIFKPFKGAVPDGRDIAPQLQQLKTRMAGANGLDIDALLISAGGNDIGFGDIIFHCANPLNPHHCDTGDFPGEIAERIVGLPHRYARLVRAIAGRATGADAPYNLPERPSSVFMTHYPDPTRDQNGQLCGSNPAGDLLSHVERREVQWINREILPSLNNAIAGIFDSLRGSSVLEGWSLVAGLPQRYATHGYCSNAPFINTTNVALRQQGNDATSGLPELFAKASNGMMHPNRAGYEQYADILLPKLEERLLAKFGYGGVAPALSTWSDSAAVLRWTDPYAIETSWQLESRPAAGGPAEVRTLDANTKRTSMPRDGVFKARVRACGPAAGRCSLWSNEVTFSTVRPGVPTDVRIDRSGLGGLVAPKLAWSAADAAHERFSVQSVSLGVLNGRTLD
ncbi:hypothetical protein EON77_09545, partial [bacterium]